MQIQKIIEREKLLDYLTKRNLLEQYKKAKEKILNKNYFSVDLKKRKPEMDEIWQFRINRQYRAFCYFNGTMLVVFKISDHQN
jgi:ribosomal protein L20